MRLVRLLVGIHGHHAGPVQGFRQLGRQRRGGRPLAAEHSKVKEALAVIRWNNELKCKRISELPDRYQEYYEEYVPQNCPHPARVRFFFDVYDDEEGRL